MEEVKKPEEKFVGHGISLNVSSGPFYITLGALVVTVLFIFSDGWSAYVTKLFFYIFLISLAFSIWFPYSEFVKRKITFTDESVSIGKDIIHINEISKVTLDGNMIEFHLIGKKQAKQVRMDDQYEVPTGDYVRKWCDKLKINLIDRKK